MNIQDTKKNSYILQGHLAKKGYVRWFHSFQGSNAESGEVRTFFIEYQILNPGAGGDNVVFGLHPRNKKNNIRPSYIMIKAGILPDDNGCDGIQVTNCYPINSIRFCSKPFLFQVEDCLYSENHLSGYVETSKAKARHKYLLSDEGSMEWDLDVQKTVSCNMGFVTSKLACMIGAMSGFWHAEGMHTNYKGHVSLNGTVYTIDPFTCHGFADKNWGKRTDRPIILLTSTHLFSMESKKEFKNSSFAVKGCFPKVFFIPLKRRLMIQLTHMGEDFEFHFASLKNLSRCRWKTKETNKRYIWHIKAQSRNAVIKISLNCTKERLMELFYENTDGKMPESPIYCGTGGMGTIEIYKKQDGELKLIDKLGIKDALCTYSE